MEYEERYLHLDEPIDVDSHVICKYKVGTDLKMTTAAAAIATTALSARIVRPNPECNTMPVALMTGRSDRSSVSSTRRAIRSASSETLGRVCSVADA